VRAPLSSRRSAGVHSAAARRTGGETRGFTVTIHLDPASRAPVYLQIVAALVREIQRGRFQPGDRLPGYRTLAESLGVGKNTVLSAYRELQAEGWVTSTVGGGSVVSTSPPRIVPGAASVPVSREQPGFDLAGEDPAPGVTSPKDLLKLGSGLPDPRHVPSAVLARAYRRAITVNPKAALEIEDPQGHPRLRGALGRLLSASRGIPAAAERILVTRGSQMAFFLAAHALFTPGDAVAVEALGDRGIWEAFARAGARCLPVPVDAGGMDVDALEALADRTPLRAVLVCPERQYPTQAPLAGDRRRRLLSLAADRRLAVLESDLDWEFRFDGAPEAPLAAEDPNGVVIHVEVLSRVFSPGLRLGVVHAAAGFVGRMREQRLVFDRHGDPVLERAMAELIEDGEIARHLNRMHKVYLRRRDALVLALRREAGEVVSIEPPTGGLALWVKVRDGVDVDAWAARALARGVAFRPGRQFAFDGAAVQGFRIGFSSFAEPMLDDVATRIGAALREIA
jgi:GntR family transcriptional regulator/MocR family aminotransferase